MVGWKASEQRCPRFVVQDWNRMVGLIVSIENAAASSEVATIVHRVRRGFHLRSNCEKGEDMTARDHIICDVRLKEIRNAKCEMRRIHAKRFILNQTCSSTLENSLEDKSQQCEKRCRLIQAISAWMQDWQQNVRLKGMVWSTRTSQNCFATEASFRSCSSKEDDVHKTFMSRVKYSQLCYLCLCCHTILAKKRKRNSSLSFSPMISNWWDVVANLTVVFWTMQITFVLRTSSTQLWIQSSNLT